MANTTPSEVLKYCPGCGSNLFFPREKNVFECSFCRFRLYINAAAAVAVFIADDSDKILFTSRAKPPQKGALDVPGGFVDILETAENAAVREIKEELDMDLDADLLQYVSSHPNIYEYKGLTYYTMDIAFLYRIKKIPDIKLSSEIEQYSVLHPDEVDTGLIGFESVKYFFKLIRNRVKKTGNQ